MITESSVRESEFKKKIYWLLVDYWLCVYEWEINEQWLVSFRGCPLSINVVHANFGFCYLRSPPSCSFNTYLLRPFHTKLFVYKNGISILKNFKSWKWTVIPGRPKVFDPFPFLDETYKQQAVSFHRQRKFSSQSLRGRI